MNISEKLHVLRARIANIIYPEGKAHREAYVRELSRTFTTPDPMLTDLPFVQAAPGQSLARVRTPLPEIAYKN